MKYKSILTQFAPPFIKHGFAEQRLDYQLIKSLHVHGSMLFCTKGTTFVLLYAFKTFVKYEILNNYVDRCYEAKHAQEHREQLKKFFRVKYDMLASF